MYGVVLWSDHVDGKAVIWCEDHGDLAYFSRAHDGDLTCGDLIPDLQAGDMVQFDLRQDARVRRASNPRLVVNQHCAGLADGLAQAAPAPNPAPCAEPCAVQAAPRAYGTAPRAHGAVGTVAGNVSGTVISFAQAAQRRLAGRLTLA